MELKLMQHIGDDRNDIGEEFHTQKKRELTHREAKQFLDSKSETAQHRPKHCELVFLFPNHTSPHLIPSSHTKRKTTSQSLRRISVNQMWRQRANPNTRIALQHGRSSHFCCLFGACVLVEERLV